MPSVVCRFVSGGLCVAKASAALAAVVPAPDALTELAASRWAASADGASAAVYDDTVRALAGSASLRYETGGAFDTRLWAPAGQDGHWDLVASGSGGVSLWVYAENPNLGFQNLSPWVRLGTDAGNYYEYRPDHELLNDALGTWVQLTIPLAGDDTWTRTTVGTPDLTDVNYIEIHADTWGSGFTLWFDDLRFDVPIQPPTGLKACAGNGQVGLAWQPYDDPAGNFDHYAVYRATAPFSDVTGMTPIATVADIARTGYTDTSAVNGVSYYYAVTAVFVGGAETTAVEPVGPRTPRDETDLQVVCIARTPRYPRYDPTYTQYQVTEPSGFGPYIFSAATGLGSGQDASTQRWPQVGEIVTYTATVRNRGTNTWSGTLSAVWQLDGNVAQADSPGVTLAPGETVTLGYQLAWDDALHEISFALLVSDDRPGNNAQTIGTRSVAFLSYVDRTCLEDFREETAGYPQAATDDFLDWLNRHMVRFNEMFAAAGCAKRVHYDVLEVIDDDAPDPDTSRIEFAIFPFRFHAGDGSLRTSGYYDAAEDLDYGLLHEMGHQLGLIDIYRLDLPASANEVSGMGYTAPAGLMHGVAHFLSQHSAGAMTHWLHSAHGYYGQYLYQLPQQVRMRFLGTDGQPLAGAAVRVYQVCERPGAGQVLTSQVKFSGTTDDQGCYTLPNVATDPNLVPPTCAGDALHDNPFGYVAVVGTNGLLHFEVEQDGFVDYTWLDITEVNNAYWAGQTALATFQRTLALGGSVQCYPPPDMAEGNAASWLGWAQDGQITLADDTTRMHDGVASLRADATGGADNYVRYPGDQLATWDLRGSTYLRFWARAENPNLGFQNASPWIHLGNADGYYEYHPAYDMLNNAIGQWVEFVIPLAGDATWQRSTHGSPDLADINYVEIHADTWGAGFTLWLDNVRFDPPIEPIPGDVNCDGAVDLSDLAVLLAHYNAAGGMTWTDGDLDADGDVDLADLAILLANYGEVC